MRPKLALQHAEDYEKKKKNVEHLRSIGNYIKKNKIKRFNLITDNASFHVSRKTKFVEKQLHWLTAIFLQHSPNLNLVEARVNRNLKKDVCALV